MEFLLCEPQKKVTVYLLLLGERSGVRKDCPPSLSNFKPRYKGRKWEAAVEEVDGTQTRD